MKLKRFYTTKETIKKVKKENQTLHLLSHLLGKQVFLQISKQRHWDGELTREPTRVKCTDPHSLFWNSTWRILPDFQYLAQMSLSSERTTFLTMLSQALFITFCSFTKNFTKVITILRILPDMNLGENLEEINFLKCISKFSLSVVSGLHKSHPRCEYLMKKIITSVSLPSQVPSFWSLP